MEKITVIIDNYNGKRITYIMPETALIESYRSQVISGKNEGKITHVGIEIVCEEGIEEIKEDLI